MIQQINHSPQEIRSFIRHQWIGWAGNLQSKIYGTLRCAAGKRMRSKNRVFFQTVDDALRAGYRPCGHCLKQNNKVQRKID